MRSGPAGRVVERAGLGGERGASGSGWLAVGLAAVLTVGCVSPPEGIEIVKGRELNDVPVKESLKFVGSETYDPALAEGARFRSWVGLYRGRGLLQDIGPWYVGAMKENGWIFTGVVQSKGPTWTYNFLKRDEEAEITVYREYSSSTGRSYNMVRAEVHPRGTESFLPEDLESIKKTGVAWAEPVDSEPREMETISFTEEEIVVEQPAPAPSEFLLDEPMEDLEDGGEVEPAPTRIP